MKITTIRRILKPYFTVRYRLAELIASIPFVQCVAHLAIEKVTQEQDDRIYELADKVEKSADAIECWDDRLTTVEEKAEENENKIDELEQGGM